jgi:secreted trypsin-like serine protease
MQKLFFPISVIGLLMLIQVNVFAREVRIINGTPAAADNWPWMVAIGNTYSTISSTQFCGGSLIHPSWILTAAHCTLDETVDTIKVLLGTHDLAQEKNAEVIKLKEIIRHPEYDKHPENPKHDIALLHLEQPSQQPILQLADYYSDLIQIGSSATVMGWGKMDVKNRNSYSPVLMQTDLPIIDNEECNRVYDGDVKETMLCAGFIEGGTDACVGDSGGPLVRADTAIDSQVKWKQIGIVSWGEGCASPGYYGVYTRTSSYQAFISEHICQGEDVVAPQLTVSTTNEQQVSLSWNAVEGVDGYQFYYAPYSYPIDERTLNHIHSLDMSNRTQLGAPLSSGASFYVAVRSYHGNCFSGFSNLEQVIIP